MEKTINQKFPPGYFIIVTVMALTMASFALIQGLLVLYCIHTQALSDRDAYFIYAGFMTFLFVAPMLGGYVGGRHLGYPSAITVGLSLATIGIYLICMNSLPYIYVGLAAFDVGNATAVTCLYVLLSRIYGQNNPLRDSGFTLSYTIMNLGALVSLGASGFLVNYWSYQIAFLISAVFMLTALLTFILGIRPLLELHIQGARKYLQQNTSKAQPAVGIGMLIGAVPIVALCIYYGTFNDKILLTLGAIAIIFLIYFATAQNDRGQKNTVIFIILLFIGLGFWALYMLAPSVLTLFILRNVNRTFYGISIPPSDFVGLNPFFIIALGFAFSALWYYLHKFKRDPSLPVKFALGISCMGLGYLILALGTHFPGKQHLISSWWVILSYTFQCAGELLISPIGFAMVGHLMPEKYEGVMMGILMLSIGIGGSISGFLAETTTNTKHIVNPAITNHIYGQSFLHFGLIALTIGIIALLLSPMMKSKMRLLPKA